jgi:hypothetical protein
MRFLLIVTGSIASILLSGCAPVIPQSNLDAADKYLGSACKAMFLRNDLRGYQFWSQSPLNSKQAVFALAIDPKTGTQSCGYATNHPYDVKENALEITTTWEKLDAVAIARCESARPASLTTPCRVFSRRNEIVWGKAGKTGLD